MRRSEGGFEVQVVAPTLGLITRISPDEPDVRAAAVASNVRFEKGVVKNAKGFQSLVSSLALDSPVNLVFQTQFFLPSTNVGIIGTARKLYSIRTPMALPDVTLNLIYDFGSNLAGMLNRIAADSFFNKVIFAQPNSPLLYWDGSSATALLVRGLDPLTRWQGVKTFRSYVIIWAGSTFKWCAPDDVFTWIPVGATATSAVFRTTQDFVIPALGDGSGWIYVDSTDAALLIIGQFLRMDFGDTTTFLSVTAVLPSTGQEPVSSGFIQSVPAGFEQNIFVNSFVPYLKGAQVYFEGSTAVMTVRRDAVDYGGLVVSVAEEFAVPPVGGTVTIKTSAQPPFALGTYVSVGYSTAPGTDIYQVQAVDLVNNKMELVYIGVGSTHSLSHMPGEYIVSQPFVTVLNSSGIAAVSGFSLKLKELSGFQAAVENLTGAAPAGTSIAAGTQILTVDANGAGELINAGSIVNGPIFQFDTLGDYGYILKNRSIQSVQYVGPDLGTFFIRPEISDEGLIGKYSFVKVGLDVMYIFGNREIYRYSGGNQLVPVAQKHSIQVLAELDKTKVDEIVGYHNEKDFEIWFAYPATGNAADDAPYRVVVYNYKEDSCTIDDYDPSVHADLVLHGITALGRLTLSPNPAWRDILGTWAVPLSHSLTSTWQDQMNLAAEEFTVGAFQNNEVVGGPTLALLNRNYDRDGKVMLCRYESVDFSAQDSAAVKYADTVYLSLQRVTDLAVQDNPYVLTVQLGSRMNFDEDIVWSNPVDIQVQGGGQAVARVNIQRTGRLLRVRLSSNQLGCGWRVSRCLLLGRMGSTY